MPYKKRSEARIKKLDGKPLSLAQINKIAAMADAMDPKKVDNPWAVAISQFKKSHIKTDTGWKKKEKEAGMDAIIKVLKSCDCFENFTIN